MLRKISIVAILMVAAATARAGDAPESPASEVAVRPKVFIIPIEDGPEGAMGMVDPWLASFVSFQTDRAVEAGADLIVYRITTYGGRVDSAIRITRTIMGVEAPTLAYVVDRAISAGALIALACDKIYMETPSQMGSASPVSADGRPMTEKEYSVVSARFKLLAERTGRNTALAQAMVDSKLEVLRVRVGDDDETFVLAKELAEFERAKEAEGLRVRVIDTAVGDQELLNMTDQDALTRFNFIDGTALSLEEALDGLGYRNPSIESVQVNWAQELARFIGGPWLSGLLMGLGSLALLREILYPSGGIGALVAVFAFGLFFWSQFMGGQAGGVEVVLFLLGIGLLAVEVFVLPGFGLAGGAGIMMIAVSLVMGLMPGTGFEPEAPGLPFPWQQFQVALFTVLASLSAAGIGLLLMMRYAGSVPGLSRLVLTETPPGGEQVDFDPAKALIGRKGLAVTDLRPAGKVDVDGDRFDAVAESEWIESGTPVEVAETGGNRMVVRRAGGTGS